jgi:uncharacterized protein (DUF302 family)
MYGFTTALTGITFEQALSRTIEALKGEGFGVLSDIDVRGAMKDKLGVEMPPYRILGACNPKLAHQALQAVPDIGLVGKPEVQAVADAAERLLRSACARLSDHSAPIRPV